MLNDYEYCTVRLYRTVQVLYCTYSTVLYITKVVGTVYYYSTVLHTGTVLYSYSTSSTVLYR